jgi:hypothetical protein
LSGATLQVALALENLEVMVDSGGGGKADRAGDLPHRWRVPPGAQRGGDEVEDPDLAFGVVLRHRASFGPHDTERTFDVKRRLGR